MSCKLEYKGREYTEAELIEVLSQDSSIVNQFIDQEQRMFAGKDLDTMDMTVAKIDHMKKLMNVEVILDSDVKTSRVLSASDPRTKAAGKPVILINPDAIFTDTVIHEFAHIFIDAFPGGLENKRLQKALKSLEGTELYEQVKALYPELSQEMFEKELLATAIGLEGAEIFPNLEKEATGFDAFKKWFYNFLKRTFGIEMDVVNSLTNELLSERAERDLIDKLSQEAQQQKIEEDIINSDNSDLSQEENSADRLYDQLITRVANASRAYKPKTQEERIEQRRLIKENKKKPGRKLTRYQETKELNEALEEYRKTDKVRGMIKFVKYSDNTINLLQSRLDKEISEGTLTPDLMIQLEEFSAVFGILKDIQIELDSNEEINPRLKAKFKRSLNRIRSNKSDFETKLLAQEREMFAELMAENDTEAIDKARKELMSKHKDLFPNANDTERNVYVTQEMEKIMPELKEESLKKYKKRARESMGDISATAFNLISEKQMGSDEIQVASRLVDKAEREISDHNADEAGKMVVKNRDFSNDVSDAANTAVKYEGMYDVSDDGVYLASEYQADFLVAEKEAKNNAYDKNVYDEKYKDVEVNADTGKYVYEGLEGDIFIEGSRNLKIEGLHVTYQPAGTKDYTTISIENAIGLSELHYWKQENTKTERANGRTRIVPADKWINKSWAKLSARKKQEITFFKEKIVEADDLTSGNESLISSSGSVKFFKLPAVEKETTERLRQGDVKGSALDYITSKYKLKDEDFDTQKAFADPANREKFKIPIAYRSRIDAKTQSLDLHTIVLMNLIQSKNYQKKKEIESTLLVMADVMQNRLVPKTHGVARRAMTHRSFKDKDVMLHNPDDFVPNDVKKMYSLIENRIYGITSKDAGSFAGMDVNKTVATALKYSGVVSLVGNWANSFVNYNVGSSANLLESLSGEHFNFADLRKAKKTYWYDSREIIKDMGSVVDSSRTNLFLNILNIMGDKTVINGRFSNTSKVEVLAEMNSLRPLAKMGEHMMQAQVMYSIMHNIKAQNAKGQFVDKNGKVVANKKDAADMNDVITFKKKDDGSVKMVIKDFVGGNSFSGATDHANMLVEMQSLIKKKIMDLHGNYDSDVQSDAQRTFWGKAMFFLRKWIEPGLFRRWRGLGSFYKKNEDLVEADKTYSKDLKSYQEGYYVTAARFFAVLLRAVKSGNFDAVKNYRKGLQTHEKANVKRVITETTMLLSLFIAYSLLNIEGDDDENLIAKYLIRRQLSEQTFFIDPRETFKIASTPTAGMGIVKNILKLANQTVKEPTERYKQGVNKGELKVNVFFKKLLPGVRDFEDVKKSLSFLNNQM